MASVADCIDKLATAGEISRKVADEALDFFKRSQAKYAADMGPASRDAAAALEAAKALAARSKEMRTAVAADVKTFRINEQRLKEDPRGPNAALAGILTKDTRIGDNKLKPLMREQPDHPIFTGGNADYRAKMLRDQMYTKMGADMEKLRPGFFKNPDVVRSIQNFVHELFGASTGDQTAATVARAFSEVSKYAADRAKAAGKIFEAREDWRLPQPWQSSRVVRFSEDEFVKDFRAAVDAGGLKLWDKDTNAYATAGRYDFVLKRAYSDIKTEGANSTPFSKEMRTFEFQPGRAGADQWLRLQGKYGVGNEIMSAIDSHIEHMSRDIALHETFGAHPDAQFAALIRMVKDNPGPKVAPGLGWLESERALRLTYDTISGKGHPVANETAARIMSGVRNIVGAASLRNLPITIVPSDSAMTFMAANHVGMSGFDVLSHVFDGTMTKDTARHLQIAAHSYMDYIADTVRRYEDQINWSGLARKVPRAIVKATGADLWTTNGRLGWQVSMLHQLADMRDTAFDKLDPGVRENFLRPYGFTEADWDKIRAAPTYDAPNGARYLDPNAIDKPLSERLLMAIKEQGSYAFHQPDARTEAIIRQGSTAGSLGGEFWLMAGQYKQFALERMTTHIMRVLVDGPIESRVGRGLAFTIASIAAGAVSLQAAAVIRGENPLNMGDPKFWLEAFTKGGAGGVYGDILAQALKGGRSGTDIAAQMMGPVPGLAGDIATLATAPAKAVLEEPGKQTKPNQAFNVARRWTPNTWYTKLAVDRLLWDKMQILLDPNYRQSFQRSEQAARKQGGGFWWSRGESAPSAPNFGTAFGAR
jgi:hypothetical protein